MSITSERIKQRRLELNLTQEELGAMVGVKKAAINKYEKDIVRDLKRSVIVSLATALRVSPLWLMGMDNMIEEKSARQQLLDYASNLSEEQAQKCLAMMKLMLGDN